MPPRDFHVGAVDLGPIGTFGKAGGTRCAPASAVDFSLFVHYDLYRAGYENEVAL